MFIWICCPEVKRSCCCARSLKLGTALICIWAILISCHEVILVVHPTCSDLYNTDTGELYKPLTVLKWTILIAAMAVFVASSALFVFGVFQNRGIAVDIFIVTGLLSIFTTVPFIILSADQMWDFASCNFDANDIVFMSFYDCCWIYFLAVVASYRKQLAIAVSVAFSANTELVLKNF